MKINGMPYTVESHRLNDEQEQAVGRLLLIATAAGLIAITGLVCAATMLILGLLLFLR